MKKTILIGLILCLSLTGHSQYKYKSTYRDLPSKGETISIAGLIILATSASGIIGHNTTFQKSVGYIGGSMIVFGLVIELKENSKHKYKRLKRR